MRSFLGLEDGIPIAIVHPTWGRTKPGVDEHTGWIFASQPVLHPSGKKSIPCDEHCIPPPNNLGWESARSAYEMSGAGRSKKFTVPFLWDLQLNCIVNNESSEIIRMFYEKDKLGQFATKNVSRPPPIGGSSVILIDAINEQIYGDVNNGVYCCGLANSQEAYETAARNLERGMHDQQCTGKVAVPLFE